MVEKDKDLFLDMLENPNLTLEDMVSVGHSAESTRFLDKSMYENSQRVRNKFMDSEGNFKQDEFDKWYAMAANAYQQITDKDTNLSLLNVTAFNESDITVSPEKRTLNTKPIVSFTPNPDRLSTSIFRVGKTSERDRTQSELAQAEKVLLNPVEAAQDPSKARWGDSPNDSWWGNFFDTQVLAQWDEDGEHIDPVTKQTVSHKKGELKLNDNGTYYYEALDGRDIYGRQVLNKMNTITTDGSFWNQYDFFDSDDIKEKSFVGSVAKNLALVGSMFIPYVGWGIAGASVATQMFGLAGTLGKMLTGSDSPTFSAMEGWAKSFDRQSAKSEYAQQNMLCWENFINLIGDTTAQLREQRAIFKFAPAIFGKGKYGINSQHFGMNAETLREVEKKAAQEAMDLSKVNLAGVLKKTGGDIAEAQARFLSTQNNIISNIADKAVKDYLQDYNKLGEQIARAYMVGITVGDTYGEAKEAGASDFEAAMLTIGYAAAENKLLNSELGRWIFPELKAERATMAQMARKLTETPAEVASDIFGNSIENTLKSSGVKATRAELIGKSIAGMSQDVRKAGDILGKLDQNSRLALMKKWFNAGKEVFNTQKSVMKGTLGAAISNALAEGTEEISEELLKDFSTSCFNIVKAAQGDKDTRMQGFLGEWDWNQALKRYGMSFFGGMIGGGINSAATDYTQFKDIANMTSEQAMQKLVWMERNNEIDKFWDIVSKETLGDKYHSSERDENGNFKLGDENDNQDLDVKRALRQQIDIVHNILSANGASIDDEGLIGQVMNALPAAKNQDLLGDFRANALATSVTAGRFLKEYNNLCKAIAMASINLHNLTSQTTDSKKPSEDLQQKITEARTSLNTLLSAKDALLQGKRSAEFYKDALFETTYGVSETFIAPTEVQFMERATGKSYYLISDKEKEELKKKYIDWSKSERSEQIHQLADIFYGVATKTSQALQDSSETYQKIKDGQLQKFEKITKVSMNHLYNLMDALNDESDPVSKVTEVINNLILPEAKPVDLHLNTNGDLELGEGSLSGVQTYLSENIEQFKQDYEQISGSTTLTAEQKIPLLISTFLQNVSSGLTNTVSEIIDSGFIHPEVKANLLPTLQSTLEYCQPVISALDNDFGLSDEDQEQFNEAITNLENLEETLQTQIKQIQELNYTPISENLKSFAVGMGSDQSVMDLLEYAINAGKEKGGKLSLDQVLLDDKKLKQFEEAEKILKLYRASIVAARNDNADLDHIFGYNKVLNELCKSTDNWQPLAEIDADTAQLAIQDVNMVLQRLEFLKELSSLNKGNKLNLQSQTAANKSYILFNKINKLITSLSDDDDDDVKAIKASWKGIDELKVAISNMKNHQEYSGLEVEQRTLSLTSEQKLDIEREQHLMDDAIYEFFQKNQDKLTGTEQATKELAKLLKVAKFDLYDRNEGLLTEKSKDIDDGSFVWWLAGKAALKGSDFYKEYRKVINDDIAPIPTQELGIFSAIAAITNGEVFSAFGKAMKQYIADDWAAKTPESRENILKDRKLRVFRGKTSYNMLPVKTEDLKDVNQSELVPHYSNILFIEGIPGSGKSTGVFKTIVNILNSMNPSIDDSTQLLDKPIYIAHSTKDNADSLAQSLNFKDTTQVRTFGKEELLKQASVQYKNRKNPDSDRYEYIKGTDCIEMPDGSIHSLWEVNKSIPENEIPSIIFIDEWSRYTQPEVDLISRFASEYGIQIIAGGDMDQLSPTAYLLAKKDSKLDDDDTIEMSISRNITARVPKLGISMRTGNGQKTENLQTLQTWQRNPTNMAVNLRYVETDTDLFGDKVYQVQDSGISDSQLSSIQKDIDKMISHLEDGEKIGYIYHDKNTNLYKLLSSDKYKDKIDFKSETDAQGLEAKYYIVENNRSKSQSQDAYLKSLYTGISRAIQASIVIAPSTGIENLLVKSPEKPDTELIPDSFTSAGVTRAAREKKLMLDKIYAQDTSNKKFEIIPRKRISIDISKKESTNDPLQDFDKAGKKEDDAKEPEQSQSSEEPEGQENQNPEQEKPNQIPSTVWENNAENFSKVVNAIIANIQQAGSEIYQFNATEIEAILNVNPNDLIIIITDLANQNYIKKLSGTVYTITQDSINSLNMAVNNVQPSQNPPQPVLNKYKKGDKVEINKPEVIPGIYEIDSVLFDPTTQAYSYSLTKNNLNITLSESEIDTLKSEGNFTTKEESETPDGSYVQPLLPSTAFGQSELETIIEGAEEASQEEEKEIEVIKDDIDFRVLGYTWNTNYLGVNFDDQGKPIIPQQEEPGARRIDQANGLVKLDPVKFNSQEALRKAIGTIRKAMMFDSNERIAEILAGKNGEVGLIPTLKGQELKIHWAFISKAAEHHTGDGGRFYYDPSYRLDNMEDNEHAKIPLKTISMLVEDQNGNCVLEMPLLTLASPFTALYKLGKILDKKAQQEGVPMTNSIILKYRNIVNDTNLTMEEIMKQMEQTIENAPEAKTSKGTLKPGYKRLKDICKLWQFTSDGIRLLDNVNRSKSNKRGERFNISKHTINLGVHYIKDRITEQTIRGEISPYDYRQVWHDLADEENRHDVNYSDIMIAPDAYDMDGNKIVAAGHPFVLRSDSDAFVYTEDMMQRYLRQQRDPNLEKIVKLELVTPPEMSVSEWLDERSKALFCNYGNEFSAYRILSLLKNLARSENPDPIAKQLWESLDHKNTIASIINALDNAQSQLEGIDGENHQEYLSRVYRAQKQIMVNNGGPNVLSSALFDLTHNGGVNNLGIREKNQENIDNIAKLCAYINPKTNRPYITGILYRPVCRKGEEKVAGFALRIQTGQNRFKTPGGKSFRIYSRYDSPSFDLTDKLSIMINNWAKSAQKGLDPDNPNIWRFTNRKVDFAFNLYNREGNTKKPKENIPNPLLKEIPQNVLDILSEDDYNSLNSITDKVKFLEYVQKKFIAIPGNVAVIVNGNSIITAKLNNDGRINSEEIDPRFANAKQVYPDGFVSTGNGDHSYILKVTTDRGIEEIDVEIIPNNSEIIFNFKKDQILPTENQSILDLTPVKTAIEKQIAVFTNKGEKYKKQADFWKNILDIVNQGGTQQQIINNLNQLLAKTPGGAIIERQLKSDAFFGKDFFENIDINGENNENNNATCSFTTVRKKF